MRAAWAGCCKVNIRAHVARCCTTPCHDAFALRGAAAAALSRRLFSLGTHTGDMLTSEIQPLWKRLCQRICQTTFPTHDAFRASRCPSARASVCSTETRIKRRRACAREGRRRRRSGGAAADETEASREEQYHMYSAAPNRPHVPPDTTVTSI